MRQVDIIIDHALLLTMDPQRTMFQDGCLIIDKGRIVDVGDSTKVRPGYQSDKVIDARGNLVMPGFVDAHLHNAQQLSRGLADDVDLITWVYERIIPYEACLTDEDVYLSAMLSCIEMIRTGTTCASDPGGYQVDNIGRAYEETGMRGIVSWAGMDQWTDDRPLPDELPGKKGTAETLAEMERVVSTWHGAASGRIRAAYGLRTEPNVSEELFKKTKQLADRDGVFIHMHTAVNQRQVDWMKKRTGYTSIEYLNHLGVLEGGNWLLAHMAAVTDAEIELLAKHDVKIAHQPGASVHGTYGAISRGKIPEMMKAGLTIGMGCDANSANNSLDMMRTMYLAATLHKEARLDPNLVPPERALEMATIEGARSIMWDDEIGSLERGKKADVIIIDIKQANWVPTHDFSIVPNLVYAGDGRDVTTTIIDGKIVMEDHTLTTVDVDDILERAQYAAQRLLTRLPYRLQPRWPLIKS